MTATIDQRDDVDTVAADAERICLGAAMQSDAVLAAVTAIMGPDDWALPRHQHIAEAITAVAARGEPVNPPAVLVELEQRNQIRPSGGAPYLTTLVEVANPAWEHYAHVAADHARLRRLDAVGQHLQQLASLGRSGAVVDDVVSRARAAVDAVVGDRAKPSGRKHLRDQLLDVDALRTLAAPQPLVSGLLYRRQLAQIAGAPGTYKSFLTVAMACAVAAGVPFEGHRVAQDAGPVVYVAAEGASGLRARIYAWCELNRVHPDDLRGRLYVLPLPIQLGNRVDVAQAIEVAAELEASLVVLDTRARMTVGLEENSASDQGHAIDAAEQLAHETGCAVLAVHHSSRNGTAGRGSNSWDGAVWTDLRVTGEQLRATVTCHKHKEVPSGCEHHFRLVRHTVSDDLMPTDPAHEFDDHNPRETLVVVADHPKDDRPSGDSAKSVATVWSIVRTCGGPKGLTRAQVVQLAREQKISRSQAYSAVSQLIGQSRIRDVSATETARYVAVPGLAP